MRVRAMALVCATVLLTAVAGAQAPPTFEVASVKPSQPGAQRGPIGFGGERVNVTAWTLPELMTLAYAQGTSLYRFQITGGPDWLDRERFDITATVDPSKVSAPNPNLLQAMLRTLLAERFKLAVRQETKEAPIYALTLASRDGLPGPKLRRTTYPCPQPGGPSPPPDPERQKNCSSRIGYGTLTGRGMTVEQLAMSMANFYGIGRIVVDRTGLTGMFDMDMEWAPMTQFRQPGNLDPPPDFADRAVNNLPTLFVALREQLGLALEPDHGPVRSIVIERVERPTPD
ncbi:MAG TPA: TIGR03435 family protein [Vicinamibacterales bacterium]|nr:TIGR03435 family protein [Vicinamibacterales bacterium]